MHRGCWMALAAVLLGAACGAPRPSAEAGAGAEMEPATGQPMPGLRTQAREYTLERSETLWETLIPISFQNPLPDTVYMVNCNGELNMTLEKKTAAGWSTFWSPVTSLCLSPPVRIAPGGTYVDTLWIGGSLPGSNAVPEFASGDLAGVYRLRWENVLLHYREYSQERPDWGDSIPAVHRTSNEFALRAGR